MDLNISKVIAMLALGIGSFVSGMIPAAISESTRQRHPLLISCLLCFGGGVLLATSLVHMLPEARVDFPEYCELMFCLGFFLVYLVDEVVHFFYGPHQTLLVNHRDQDTRQNYGATENAALLGSNKDGRGADDELGRDRCCGDTDNPMMCHVSHTAPCNKSSSGIVGLLCALFVHSVLEGLAIGLQESATEVLLLLGAVSCHKYVVGFCLGAELCASSPGRLCTHLLCVTLFSIGSVAGIGIGAGLDSMSSLQDSVAVPIMQALAAGTLLYVTVSEVLPRERARWHERKRSAGIAQFTSVGVGFVLMYLSTKFLDRDGV